MRKSKLISVRVPVDVLNRLDEVLKNERFINRSSVICALLDVATSTLQRKQLDVLSHFSSYYGHRVKSLHLEFRRYGQIDEIHFVDESQKSAAD